jgi:hypothetical protein
MYVGQDFDPSDVGEDELYTFDFVNDVACGETIVTATWSCAAVDGQDPDAASRVVGPASWLGTETTQRVAGMLAGVRYRLLASAFTTFGNTKHLWSHVTSGNPN